MSKDKSNSTEPKAGKWGLVEAKSRDWTDAEVTEAVEYLKKDIPETWAELEKLEMTTGDLRGTDAVDMQYAILKELHPECEFYEISQLGGKVRDLRRAQLGLK